MPSPRRHRSLSSTLFAVVTLAGICGFPWSVQATHRLHTRAAAAEAAAFAEPARFKMKQAVRPNAGLKEILASFKPVRRLAHSIREMSMALAVVLLPAQTGPLNAGKSVGESSTGFSPLPHGFNPSKMLEADSRTAVYDISARAVYLPDGTKLEAHSGLGKFMDDPNSVKEKNRGVTPPNVYDLTLREQPFHGVLALRLTPVAEDAMHGREGILAHRYMLGPSGQSNGCVVFKDYPAFLQAFLSGLVNRLVVVPSTAAAAPANPGMAGG